MAGDIIRGGTELFYSSNGARPEPAPAQPPEVTVNGVPAEGDVYEVLAAARMAERERDARIVAGLTRSRTQQPSETNST